MELFNRSIGLFKGFAESGLEYSAEIVSPYDTEYRPILGDFILVELNKSQAILGRITKFYPVGIMSSSQGQDYLASISRMNEEVPEDLKENKLRYSINISLLGTITDEIDTLSFTPSVRSLPHLGAKVTTLSESALAFACTLGSETTGESTKIGYLALGDRVYDGMREKPMLPVTFNLSHLIARRSFIFARAGYGKSNLIKLLTAKLYEKTQPGGMLIFDPEGEYAFADKKGRPGLCDIEGMAENMVVFTDRDVPTEYGRWVQGGVKLNLNEFSASEVVNLCVMPEKQEANFANMVRGLSDDDWSRLIDLLYQEGYRTPDEELKEIIGATSESEQVSRNAIKNNLTSVVRTLHEPGSNMLRAVRYHLSKGCVVIVDISLKSSVVGNRIMGLILNELFRQNQENFTVLSGRGY
ncbi:MAG: DUF87 domain-containing protein [Actinobacteria bacterium]|nr:DUF87 domain-containing protein [Actinomycetota bacterium]